MAIGYARVEFVKRSNNKTSCAKAAYTSRNKIEFHGNCALDPETFDWSNKEPPPFHEILLPSGVNQKFKDPQILWNAVEVKEKKYNSQVAIELLLALPDDKVISLDDRIHLAKTFIQKSFIDKGLAAQIDIHSPEKRIRITRDNREIGVYKEMLGNVISEREDLLTVQFDSKRVISFNPKEFNGFIETENNWHAHVLITTRRFSKNGLDLEDSKARDLMPRICKGKVVSGDDWGKLWTDHQNAFFAEKGLNLRVDANGIEPQEHLGPVRMRGRAFDLLEEHTRILDSNSVKAKDPYEVLEKITERQSVFTKNDVDHFIQKHLPLTEQERFREAFWKQQDIIPLVGNNGKFTGKFSSEKIVKEEADILRLADKIYQKEGLPIYGSNPQLIKGLNSEQKQAFESIVTGKKLSCIQGFAGTGKSLLLNVLKQSYIESGYGVRAFGPDNATSDVLREKGFQSAENVYRFLYGFYNSKRIAAKNNEVWILDEAGKLGNRPLLQLLKAAYKQGAHVILSGDNAQLFSVERGGMFQVFCERYHSLALQDIQRQKQDFQREIAKNLALGEVGSAIDKLVSFDAVKWSSLKKEAVEALISKWAADTKNNPKATTLIIAHSNDEVRVLNEMVRIIKKQRGELTGKEFVCETFLGKIYVSVGDKIEFRKNEKDLSVTNGLCGTLIDAHPSKFVVAIEKEGVKDRIVTFNPQEYSSYQLGYASTHYRSQGKTVDMAYVLHHPFLNKRHFYVGLTRHTHEAYYFVSKDQAYCLSDLKRQASRLDKRETTLAFTSPQSIEYQATRAQKERQIQGLKESESLIERMKGHGLGAYEFIRAQAGKFREYVQDRTLSEEFFQRPTEAFFSLAKVEEYHLDNIEQPREILKSVLKQERQKENEPQVPNVGHLKQPTSLEQVFERAQKIKSSLWEGLSLEQKEILRKYFDFSTKVSTLHSILEIESESNVGKELPHQKEWEISCGQRNAVANELAEEIPKTVLNDFLGKKIANSIQEQASRFQSYLDQKQSDKFLGFERDLKANIEPLLYRLFPEGPHRKNRNEFRFGQKGSLSVICSGEKAGYFFDFEQQEGGGLLKLVQRRLGLGRLEALDWAKEFLGEAREIKVPKAFLKRSEKIFNGEWVAVTPNPNVPSPPLKSIGKLSFYFNETARYAYQDEEGQLLYYRLRLVDKSDSSKKITPPLCYGYWKSNPLKLSWQLKGSGGDKSTLYNLPLLKNNPIASVLIVEGEKTADSALQKFPDQSYITITWPGGAGSVKRADWVPLVGRNVLIWPDNDKAGYQAAEDVCKELRKIGVESLKLIDPEKLQKLFPEKWDLADPLPSQMNKAIINDLYHSSIEKGVNPDLILKKASSLFKEFDIVERARANEVLWRVDARLRTSLEQTFSGQPKKINELILDETTKLLLKHNSHSSKDTSWLTLIYEATYGQLPAKAEVKKMQAVLSQTAVKDCNKIELFALDRLRISLYEQDIRRKSFSNEDLRQEISKIADGLKKQAVRLEVIELQVQSDRTKNQAMDLRR